MDGNKLRLKTKIKLLLFKFIDSVISFLFRIRILKKDNKRIKKEILQDLKKKEPTFTGGAGEFDLKEIIIEIVNRCNTVCIMCPRTEQKRKSGVMALDFYEKLIQEAFEMGARAVYPYFMGESLVLKNFCDYVRIARKIGYTTVMLTTTGGPVKQFDPLELATCGLTIINFSLDSVRQETYGKIRTNMKLDEIEQAVLHLVETRNKLKSDLKIHVKFMDFPGINDGEWEIFEKKWNNKVDAVYHTVIHDWGGRTSLSADSKFSPDEYCRYLRQKLIFNWDGTAAFCCKDYDKTYPIGKYPEQSIREIIKSPRLAEARKMHNEGRLSEHIMCKQCYMDMDGAVMNYYSKNLKNKISGINTKIRGKADEFV